MLASSCASKHSIDWQAFVFPSKLFFEIPSARETIALLIHEGARFTVLIIVNFRRKHPFTT